MRNLVDDLLTETAQFGALLARMRDETFAIPTDFKGWSSEDVLRHLLRGDALARLAMTDPLAFTAAQAQAAATREAGATMRDLELDHAGDARGVAVMAVWQDGVRRLAADGAAADPSARVPWGTKSMSVSSLLSARLMEAWAHAQAVYDMLGLERRSGDHLFSIALLGARTYDWTFACRGEPVPGPAPRIALVAPSGASWTFNETATESSVSGDAVEFCQVVCQVRNVADTGLHVVGAPAARWMARAQCFAGPPHQPPVVGSRRRHPAPRGDLLKDMVGETM